MLERYVLFFVSDLFISIFNSRTWQLAWLDMVNYERTSLCKTNHSNKFCFWNLLYNDVCITFIPQMFFVIDRWKQHFPFLFSLFCVLHFLTLFSALISIAILQITSLGMGNVSFAALQRYSLWKLFMKQSYLCLTKWND